MIHRKMLEATEQLFGFCFSSFLQISYEGFLLVESKLEIHRQGSIWGDGAARFPAPVMGAKQKGEEDVGLLSKVG